MFKVRYLSVLVELISMAVRMQLMVTEDQDLVGNPISVAGLGSTKAWLHKCDSLNPFSD